MAEQHVRRGLPRTTAEQGSEQAAAAPEPTSPSAPAPASTSDAPSTPAANGARRAGLPRPGQAPPAASAAAHAVETTAAPRLRAPVSPTPTPMPNPVSPASTPARRRRLPVIIVALVVIAGAAILIARWFLLGTPAGAEFLKRYPGTVPPPDWVPTGIPAWLGWQHFLNAFFIVLVIKTGWIVRTTRRPSASWTRRHPSPRSKKITIELFAHLSLDLVWIVNGVVFVVLLFCTGQWARIVPTSWDVFPNAASAGLQYLSLDWPSEDGWVAYNSLQVVAYFVTVFLAAPLAAISGFRMSPLWPARAERLSRAYPVELARAIHFPVMLYFVVFVVVHVGLVFSTGALANLNHMYGGQDAVNWWGLGVFALSLAATVGGWFLIRPALMAYAGSLVGKVGR